MSKRNGGSANIWMNRWISGLVGLREGGPTGSWKAKARTNGRIYVQAGRLDIG